MRKKKAIITTIAFVIFISSVFGFKNTVKAETDTSRFGEVLVSDSGTSPTIQNGNTTRKLSVASDGTIYATYHCTEGIRVAKSLDEGKTFQSSVLAYNKNLEAEIAVSTDGSVYLAWVESSNIKLSKSTDGGATFQTPVVVGTSSNSTVHMATDGNYIYIIDQAGIVLHRSIDAGATFTSVTLSSSSYVFSDVHVDPTTHTVIVQEDNPSIKYYLSTDYGKTFGSAKTPSAQVYYSVGSIGSDSTGKYLLIAGYSTTGVKINLDTGVVTNPVMGNNVTSQGRSLSDDVYGNMATGYSDNTYVYLQVSHDLGSTFGTPIKVAQSTVANASINTTNGDILFLYERSGKIYLKVYGNLLKGYNLNVSNSSLYFNADNNDVSKDVTITNTSDQPLDINSITVSGDFTIDTSGVNSTLAANESAVVHVNYKHSVIGTTTGKISINYGSNSDVKYINLTGYVTKALPVTPVVSAPSDSSVNNGASATFSVTASVTDNGTLSYQWQSSNNNGSSWNDVTTGSGATTNSYTTGIVTSTDNGTQYRCIVKNTIDSTVSSTTSSVATLTINAEAQPTIDVTGVPTDWKNNAKLSIAVTVGTSGVKCVTVNGQDITDMYGSGYTVTQNGSYTFEVTSNSGLTASQTVTVESIDSTAPNKAVIANADQYTDHNWYNTDQTVTAGFTATQGSPEKLQYSLDGGKTWADGTSAVVTKEGINIVSFRVIDDLGNASEPQSVTVQIDKTNPSLTLSDGSGWKASNVTIDVTAEDALSGVQEVTYTTDETVPQTGTVTLINGKGTITLTNEGQYKITVTEKDKAGNTVSKSENIQLDKTVPTIHVTGVPTDWKNNSKLSIAVTAGTSGVKSVTVNGQDITDSYGSGYTVTQNGSYTFEVTSNSGLTASQTVTVESIDSTAPNKAVIANADQYTEHNWYNTDQTVTAGFIATQGSLEKVQYSLDGGKTWTDGTSAVVTKEGINIVSFRVIDDLGNASEPQSVTVQIDKTNPSLSLSDVTGWKTSNVTIDVTAEDALSGMQEVSYTTDETVPQTGTVTLVNGKGTITLTNEGQYKITVTAKDNAGNTVSKSVAIQLDKTVPTTPVINNVVDSHSTKITGTAEPGSKVTVKDSIGNIIGDGIADANGKYLITITRQVSGTVLYVSATDISGNVSDKTTIQVVPLTSHVADMIDALPDPKTASDDEIVSKQDKITETKQSYDALDQDGRDLISADRKEKLDNLISRLNALLVIMPNDKTTGIKVEGVGTAVVVDELGSPEVSKVEISLNVKPVETANPTTTSPNIAIATTGLQTSGQEILAAYDISLIKSIYGASGNLDSTSKVNNSNIVDYITVRIPIPASYLGRNDLIVVYIDDNGIVHPYDTKIVTIDGVQYLEFQTNHFSEYAIVGNSQTSSVVSTVATGDTNPVVMLIVLLGISGVILLAFRKKITKAF